MLSCRRVRLRVLHGRLEQRLIERRDCPIDAVGIDTVVLTAAGR
jgi:hypothetical protein